MGENWNIDTHTFSRSVAILFHKISTLWYSKSRDKCSSFPMNFSLNGNMQQNPSYNKNLSIPILLPSYFSFGSIEFPSYDILHSMDGTCVFTRISRSMVKFSERPYQMVRTWNIDTHTFLKIWVISPPSSSRRMKYWKKRHPIFTIFSQCVSFHI